MTLEFEKVKCPLCSTDNDKDLYFDKRMAGASGEVEISVKQCSKCGFIYNSPRLSEIGLNTYYENSDLGSGQVFRDESAKGHYSILHTERANFLKSSLTQNIKFNLLDIGCGNGGFLNAVIKQIPYCNARGLDPSNLAVKNCKQIDIEVIQGSVNDLSSMNLDVDIVSMISVLEHLPNPREALKEIKKFIGSNGILYLEIPNTLEPEVSLTGFFNFEHIVHFTPSTLYKLLEEEGFHKIIQDESVSNVVRVIASSSNQPIFSGFDIQYEDDREKSKNAILKYINDERVLVHGLRDKVKSLLQNWKKRNKKIAIYGAGLHTIELSSHIDLAKYVDCYLDGDANKQNKVFLGKKVYSPMVAKDLDIDAVIISSGRFIEEMHRTIIDHGKKNLIVETCYE